MKQTRTIEEVKVWILIMNPMMEKTESTRTIAISLDKQKLIDWYENEKTESPYNEDGPDNFCHGLKSYDKVFKKGGLLEWMNPINDFENVNHYGQGLCFIWIQEDDIPSELVMIY